MTEIHPSEGCVLLSGAGSGLGRAMAMAFAERGFRVVGLGRSEAALQETAGLCAPGLFVARPCDVAELSTLSTVVAGIWQEHGPVAVLVNNAAIYPRRDFLDETPESFAQTVSVNLLGVAGLSNAVLKQMATVGTGRILNVATFADMNPLPSAAAYSVSKGAARILTRAMIADLGDRFPGIVIGDWMPGMLATDMGIPDGLDPAVSAQWGVTLALKRDPLLNGAVFEMNREILPPRGLKGKVKDLLTFNRPRPRML
ncbi:SDR family NAD(P)-dependent oxidoreductase [Cognatishimia sp. F0-27]|uniref:SDR family NAD(P)-dependent oxidoreductase n=1 Tax=Cognatishimia sp. F0-27 TaxID=2816855 RepID=UPI001D0C854C|nr:SDR family oxidoreductase [Cognatishimia sp. F0-27]MCC1491380.1 SDR family oxidoreductase [Cognatishimia sp. F0-27]